MTTRNPYINYNPTSLFNGRIFTKDGLDLIIKGNDREIGTLTRDLAEAEKRLKETDAYVIRAKIKEFEESTRFANEAIAYYKY